MRVLAIIINTLLLEIMNVLFLILRYLVIKLTIFQKKNHLFLDKLYLLLNLSIKTDSNHKKKSVDFYGARCNREFFLGFYVIIKP